MEKVVYVMWQKSAVTAEDFKTEILGSVARKLLDLGARGLSVNLADDQAAYARASRLTRMEDPVAGTLSVWLDTVLGRGPLEDVLAAVTRCLAGYLVVESVPLVNTTKLVPPGERTPGITTVALLEKPERMTYEAWREQWQAHHTQVAIETQSTFFYVQNVVVRPLTESAPPWVAIVDEGFPAAAPTDPMVFYAADSQAQLEENQRRMLESCQKFLDIDRVESHPMSTYVIADLGRR